MPENVEINIIGRMDLSQLTKELSKAQKELSNFKKEAGGVTKGGKLTIEMKGATGGVEGMASMLGVLGGIAVGITAVVAAVNMVSDKIKGVKDELRKVSPRLDALTTIQKRTFDMVLKPFGDFVATLARPYLMLMRTVARESLRKSRDVLRRQKEGLITAEAAQEELSQIMAATYLAMEPLKREMQNAIGPMAGFMAGFEDVTGVIGWFDTALRDLSTYVEGVLTSMGEFAKPETWEMAAEMLGKAVSDNVDILDKLSPKFAEAHEKFKDLPEDTANVAKGLDLMRQTIGDIISGTGTGSLEAFNTAVRNVNRDIKESAEEMGTKVNAFVGYFPPTNPFSSMVMWTDVLVDAFRRLAIAVSGALGEGAGGGGGGMKQYAGFRGWWEPTTLDDFISRPGQAPISFSPDDTIVGTKGGGQTLNINISGANSDLKRMIENTVESYMRTQYTNY